MINCKHFFNPNRPLDIKRTEYKICNHALFPYSSYHKSMSEWKLPYQLHMLQWTVEELVKFSLIYLHVFIHNNKSLLFSIFCISRQHGMLTSHSLYMKWFKNWIYQQKNVLVDQQLYIIHYLTKLLQFKSWYDKISPEYYIFCESKRLKLCKPQNSRIVIIHLKTCQFFNEWMDGWMDG